MTVNRRTVTLIIIVVIVVGGVYGITLWQRARETQQMLSDLMSRDHGVATKAMTGLRDRTGAVSDNLISYLDRGHDDVRWRAAMLLGAVNTRASREALIDALRDPSPDVRLNAALSLGHLGATKTAARIAMLAADAGEPVAVRTAAVRALELLRAGEQMATVVEILEDRPPVPEPEEETEEEAETEGTAEAEEPAEEEEEEEPVDETAPLREEAARALARIAPVAPAAAGEEGSASEASPILRAADILRDSVDPEVEPSDVVRQAACYALSDLAEATADDEVQARAVKALIFALDDEIGDVRIAAAHALRLLRPPTELAERVGDAFDRAVNDSHYWVRHAARKAVEGG
ncbi:MAG: HEAT repeat domain-containing protein [Armatimonadota bacterium]|nr:HEAT repeat domain-containing protein [Armatimonadota bacterium]